MYKTLQESLLACLLNAGNEFLSHRWLDGKFSGLDRKSSHLTVTWREVQTTRTSPHSRSQQLALCSCQEEPSRSRRAPDTPSTLSIPRWLLWLLPGSQHTRSSPLPKSEAITGPWHWLRPWHRPLRISWPRSLSPSGAHFQGGSLPTKSQTP